MGLYDGNDIIPSKLTIQHHEFKCFQCGFGNRFVRPPEFIDWKKESKELESRYHSLIHHINDLMAYSERHYGLNPAKDDLIDALTKIREKFCKE